MKKSKAKAKRDPRTADPAVDPLVAAELQAKQDECDHVDDDNDGVCDLCGVEVEVEVDGSDNTSMAQPDKRFTNSDTGGSLDPPPTPAPVVLGSVMAGPKRARTVTVGQFRFGSGTYKHGDTVDMTDDEAARNKKYVQ